MYAIPFWSAISMNYPKAKFSQTMYEQVRLTNPKQVRQNLTRLTNPKQLRQSPTLIPNDRNSVNRRTKHVESDFDSKWAQ